MMNAASRLVSRTASRRFASTGAIPKVKAHTNKENFFSDPSTYPLIVIMGCAMVFMTGMGINALVSYKDVQIDPSKRNAKMQTWGTEETPSQLSRAVHWNSYQKKLPEGLGYEHADFLKSKKTKTSDTVQQEE